MIGDIITLLLHKNLKKRYLFIDMDKKRILIIGAGISGCTLAEKFASLGNEFEVILVEKRSHIAGNCYDFIDRNGILVPGYGPHYFHTDYEDVWEYVKKFSEWKPYEHRVLSYVDKKHVPIPVNITTINKLLGENLRNEEDIQKWLEKNTLKIKNPKNSEEMALSLIGEKLYEKLFKNYTKKQWNKHPRDLHPLVISRIPVRKNFDDRYFNDKYQMMPFIGYTNMFNNMLKKPNIKLFLNIDYFKSNFKDNEFDFVFFTGRIDSFFKYLNESPLSYRSLIFKHEFYNKEFFQKTAVINYPNDYRFIRITEPKHANFQKSSRTTIIKEYPHDNGEPYYPVFSDENNKILKIYQKEAKKAKKNNIYMVGRLAEFKYFNMDDAFKNALNLFNNIFKKNNF